MLDSVMVKDKMKSVSRISLRHGEGHVVDIIEVNGNAALSRADGSSLPVPERQFAADAAGVLIEGNGIRLLFAQQQPIGGGLISLLVINMSFESVEQWLRSIDINFSDAVKILPSYVRDQTLSDFGAPAAQTVVLVASYAMTGFSGSSACLDFYFSSPFALHQAVILKKLSFDPVVRVNLPTGVLWAILNKIRSSAGDFPTSAKVSI